MPVVELSQPGAEAESSCSLLSGKVTMPLLKSARVAAASGKHLVLQQGSEAGSMMLGSGSSSSQNFSYC